MNVEDNSIGHNDLLNLQSRVEYIEFLSGKNNLSQIKINQEVQDQQEKRSDEIIDPESLCDKWRYCLAQFSRIEKAPFVTLLFKKYEQLEKILNSKEINKLDITSKIAILLSIEDEYKEIYKQTQIIEAHQQFLNTETFQEIPKLNTQLKPLQQIHLDQIEATNQANIELEALLKVYNDTLQIISQKFLYWDSILNFLEEKVNKLST